MDRFVEREIQSLLVHCIHQEEGCDWKDELRKREVTSKLQYDVEMSHDVYPVIRSRETQKSGHSKVKNKNMYIKTFLPYRPCHLVMKVRRSL